jgi:hypothetical protein
MTVAGVPKAVDDVTDEDQEMMTPDEYNVGCDCVRGGDVRSVYWVLELMIGLLRGRIGIARGLSSYRGQRPKR